MNSKHGHDNDNITITFIIGYWLLLVILSLIMTSSTNTNYGGDLGGIVMGDYTESVGGLEGCESVI